MSELIQKNDNRATIRWKLLTGASALALTAYVSTIAAAKAEDTDRPTLWIELGGELDQTDGLSGSFTAPFMTAISPTPAPYRDDIFSQTPPRWTGGMDGKISFQPEDSDWSFSAAIRYGRSHSNQHMHHQTPVGTKSISFYVGFPFYTEYTINRYIETQPLADKKFQFSEQHAILDFQAGKDVGLGILGSNGTSTVNAGVRFAQFTSKSALDIQARPSVDVEAVPFLLTFYSGYIAFTFESPEPNFRHHEMHARAARSFKGVGPSLSWNGSAVLAGNPDNGELTLDIGVSGALLFGKQKAKIDHTTESRHFYITNTAGGFSGFRTHYDITGFNSNHTTRSRSVTVPNIGGFAGLSVKYPNVKVSIGYRYDTFLNAMDTGIDASKKSNVSFNGPYASISIGLGD